jgi:carboxyl-terminal processing protease
MTPSSRCAARRARLEITILREGEDPFDVTLTREVIEQKSVTWKLETTMSAIIRVSTFNERTTRCWKRP